MELFTLILSIIAAVLISSFISRFLPSISTPLVQIALGIVMALLPFFPKMQLDPELFMVLFIAPLLYHEAHTINRMELRKSLNLSLSLAIGLAAFTMLMVGILLHLVWPMYPLAAALALGAALGPTDAVAVSSIGENADLSSRQRSVLSGESLFNDATGVIGFQFAIIAATTGNFSPAHAAGKFLLSFIGGIVFGAIMGFVVNWMFESARRLGWETMTTRVLMELFLPFLIYLVADNWLHVSGILAVVATGLVARFEHTGSGPNTSKTNIVSNSVWSVLSFSLNGAVFILLGMLLPSALMTSWSNRKVGNESLIAMIAVVSLIVIVVRFCWVAGVLFFETDSETGQRVPMTRHHLRSALVMTFGGPKGTITLALMLTIPYTVASGAPFPMRNELVFIAAGVIVVTLLLANFGLPLLAPAQDERVETAKVEKAIEVLRRTVEELSSRVTKDNQLAVQQVITQYNQRISRLKSQIGQDNSEESEQLKVQTLTWQQEFMENKLSQIEQEIESLQAQPDSDSDGKLPALQSQEEAASRTLERLSNSLAHVDRHGQLKWRTHLALRSLHALSRHIIHRLRHMTPNLSDNEVFLAGRKLQAEMNHDLVEKLYSELGKGRFETEDLLTTIINHQLIESAAEGKTDFGGAPTVVEHIEEVKNEGYSIELSVIQDMVESGDLSYGQAKDLRRNVYIMQVDLDSVL